MGKMTSGDTENHHLSFTKVNHKLVEIARVGEELYWLICTIL